jgi:hypothetical protein
VREDVRVVALPLALPELRNPVCGLPSFALPHKRFVSAPIREKAQAFLGSEQSYRASVRQAGKSLVYDDRQNHPLARRGAALAPSTVWRWLSWLGDGLPRTLQAARQLIAERDRGSALHRETWPVSPRKYRSEPRRQTLQRSAELLVLAGIFPRLFGKAIFPDLATGRGWG